MTEIGSIHKARRTFSAWQIVFMVFFLAGSVALLILWTKIYLIILVSFATLFYIVTIAYKIHYIFSSLKKESLLKVNENEIKWFEGFKEWPLYTIAVPLYKEANILPSLVNNLESLDYPKDKLQIFLLLEEDDTSTIKVAEDLNLPSYYEIMVFPDHYPKTKPYVLNEALKKTRGKYFTIYDAEDRPEPDQLKKAVAGFYKVDQDKVVCLQSRLLYYNVNANILTKWFDAEYSAWFNLTMPGISKNGKLVPLGGTSNHFSTQFLKETGGWDAYNVTEDCELGVYISRNKKRTLVLDTVTWEEASATGGKWIKQRSRWMKGFMQTYFTNMRNPFKLLKDLGFTNFINFQILIGGTPFGNLINPFFWFLFIAWWVFRLPMISEIYLEPVYTLGLFALIFGNFMFIYTFFISTMVRKQYGNIKYMIFIYLYWILMSVGAWKGLFQLIYKPHYWEKTMHELEAGAKKVE